MNKSYGIILLLLVIGLSISIIFINFNQNEHDVEYNFMGNHTQSSNSVNENVLSKSNITFEPVKIKTKADVNNDGDVIIMLNFPIIPYYSGYNNPELSHASVISDNTGIYVFVNILSEDDRFDKRSLIMKFDFTGNLIWSYVIDRLVRVPYMLQDDNYIYIVGRDWDTNYLLWIKVDKNTGIIKYVRQVQTKKPGDSKGLTRIFSFNNGDWLANPYIRLPFDVKNITYYYDTMKMSETNDNILECSKVGSYSFFDSFVEFKLTNGEELRIDHECKVTNGGLDIRVEKYSNITKDKEYYFFGTDGNDYLVTYWPPVDTGDSVIIPVHIHINNFEGHFTLMSFDKNNGRIRWVKTYFLPMGILDGYEYVFNDKPFSDVRDLYDMNIIGNTKFNYNIVYVYYNKSLGIIDYVIELFNYYHPYTYDEKNGYQEIIPDRDYYKQQYDPSVYKEYYPDWKYYYHIAYVELRVNPNNGTPSKFIPGSSVRYYNSPAYLIRPSNIMDRITLLGYYVDKEGYVYIVYLENKRIKILRTTEDKVSQYGFEMYPLQFKEGLATDNAFGVVETDIVSQT